MYIFYMIELSMMRLRFLIIFMLLCVFDVSVVNSYTKISLDFITQKALILKCIHDKKIFDQKNQKEEISNKSRSFINCVVAFQKKISDAQENINELHDDIMEYIYTLLLLREAELLGLDASQDQLDIRELMTSYSREDRKAKKEAKREAKREAKEAKQEAKETRKKSSSGGQQSNSQQNSSSSKQAPSEPSFSSSSQSNSQQNVENSAQSPQDTTDTTDATISDTTTDNNQINVNIRVDDISALPITITPSILGDMKYDPTQDPANNPTDNDKNKISEKPSSPPVEKDSETNPKIPFGMQQSIDNFGQQGPQQNNQPLHDFVQDFNQAYQQRYLQKCYQYGYDKNMSSAQKDMIRQQASQEALREVDNEFKKAHEEKKVRQDAAQKEKEDKKAADQQAIKDRKARKKAELAPDRGVAEKVFDYLFCRTKRKKAVPPKPSGPQLDDQKPIDQTGPPVGMDDVTSQEHQDMSGQNSDALSDQQQNSQGSTKPQDSNTPPQLPDNNHNPVDSNSPTPSSESPDNQDPTPVAQSYWDYLCSFVSSLIPGDGSQEFGDSSSSSDSDDRDTLNTCKMPHDVAVQVHDDMIKEFDKLLSKEDVEVIDFLLGCLQRATNDMTVELAQGALQAFGDFKKAESDADRDYYEAQYQEMYDVLHSDEPLLAISQQARSIRQEDIDALLQQYSTALEGHVSNTALDKKFEDLHIARLKKRQQALLDSKKQVDKNSFKNQSYDVSPQARGFMMTNQMNYAAFDQMKGTNFQHCLLQENLQIVEFASGMLMRNPYGSIIKDFTKQICNVAVSAQQLNQLGHIKEAAAITDINHFYNRYREEIYDLDYEIQSLKKIGVGACQGATQFLLKWAEFGENLCNEPGQTVGQMVDNLSAIGNGLLGACSVAYTHSPQAYMSDYIYDLYDVITTGKSQEKSRAQIRCEQNTARINKGFSDTITAGHDVIINMMNKSMQENAADYTETTLDGIIYAIITQGVMTMSHHIGNELVHVARDIKQAIPPHLLGKSAKFVADEAGQLIAVAEGTGEQITLSMKASGKNLSTGPKRGMKKPKQLKGGNKPIAPTRVKPPVWDHTTQQFFENVKNNSCKSARVGQFGNYYQDPKTKLWWSKDVAQHSCHHYKVFKETSKGFEWMYDADLLGKEIIDKHKGLVGRFIPRKDIIFKS